jgi:hypothetical protein
MGDSTSTVSSALRFPWPLGLAGLALAGLVAVNLPMFLRMPLWNDVHHYDLCAHDLLAGRALYRDVFDNNLPGIVWLQAVCRSLIGWSPEAIRAVDFVLLAATAGLLGGWWRGGGRSWGTVVGTAAAVLAFDFATSESCHFQRDPWMLGLAVAALWLRRGQMRRLAASRVAARSLFVHGLVEGLIWGAAVWLKPFVLVPALACWAVSRRLSQEAAGRLRFADNAALLTGGLLAGALGVGELYVTGSWPAFREIFFVWNTEYWHPIQWSLRLWLFFWGRFRPWGLLHVLALPLATRTVFLTFVRPLSRGPIPSEALLAACYLGWVVQVLLIQRGWNYVNAPPVVLAVALLGGWVSGLRRPVFRAGAILAFGAAVALWHPMFRLERLALWPRCWSEPSASRLLRQHLALEREPDWASLDRVADYLRAQHVADGDVLCYHVHTVPLYTDLHLSAPTRFMYPEYYLKTFPQHRSLIAADLASRRPVYVVTDLDSVDLAPPKCNTLLADGVQPVPVALPIAERGVRPWSEPVVFRAGRYAVHRLSGTEGAW